jgi:hypothetical protein
MELSRFKAMELIKATKGRIFSATFIKKDGSIRTINARTGVQNNLQGGNNGASSKKAYITVYDMVNKGYRMVNLETLMNLKINRIAYQII